MDKHFILGENTSSDKGGNKFPLSLFEEKIVFILHLIFLVHDANASFFPLAFVWICLVRSIGSIASFDVEDGKCSEQRV